MYWARLTVLMRESSTLTANAVPQANGCVMYNSVSGSSSSSWSKNCTFESLPGNENKKLSAQQVSLSNSRQTVAAKSKVMFKSSYHLPSSVIIGMSAPEWTPRRTFLMSGGPDISSNPGGRKPEMEWRFVCTCIHDNRTTNTNWKRDLGYLHCQCTVHGFSFNLQIYRKTIGASCTLRLGRLYKPALAAWAEACNRPIVSSKVMALMLSEQSIASLSTRLLSSILVFLADRMTHMSLKLMLTARRLARFKGDPWNRKRQNTLVSLSLLTSGYWRQAA